MTKIIVGKPLESRWRDLIRGAYVYELTRKCGDIDVYVISGDQNESRSATSRPKPVPASHRSYAGALLAVVVCTAIGYGMDRLAMPLTNIVMTYLLGVVAAALFYGRGPSMLASALGVLAFDYFFVPPKYTFAVEDTQYLFTFAVMFLTGIIVSTLVARLSFQAVAAQSRTSHGRLVRHESRVRREPGIGCNRRGGSPACGPGGRLPGLHFPAEE